MAYIAHGVMVDSRIQKSAQLSESLGGLIPAELITPTSLDLCHPEGFFPLESVGKDSGHNPLAMPSSIPYKACTKDPKSVWGNPIKCLANLGCKLLMIMLI